MALFLSTHLNKIDKKGRVSVPASFRTVLSAQSFQGVVVFRSFQLPAGEGFAMDRLERLSAQIDTLEPFSEGYDDLTASIFADAVSLAFDGEGRILLPETIMAHAQLTEQVAFVGRGATFQIWNPERFQAHQEAARERLRLTRPSLGHLAALKPTEPQTT